jgi:glycosidase
MDGIRVNLPLIYNGSTNSYNISYSTINEWNQIKSEIEKKSKSKLLLIDIPFGLEDIINEDLFNKTTHLLYNNKEINSKLLDQRLKSFKMKPLFWQLGSLRRNNQIELSKEIVLTLNMLIGGTPIIIYGEEIGLDQVNNKIFSFLFF